VNMSEEYSATTYHINPYHTWKPQLRCIIVTCKICYLI